MPEPLGPFGIDRINDIHKGSFVFMGNYYAYTTDRQQPEIKVALQTITNWIEAYGLRSIIYDKALHNVLGEPIDERGMALFVTRASFNAHNRSQNNQA